MARHMLGRRRWWQRQPTPVEPYKPAFSYRPAATYSLPLVETWESCRTRR